MENLKSEHATELKHLSKSMEAKDVAEATEKNRDIKIQEMSPNTVIQKLNAADQLSCKLKDSKGEVARLIQEGDRMRAKLVEYSEGEAKTCSLENEVIGLRKKVWFTGGFY